MPPTIPQQPPADERDYILKIAVTRVVSPPKVTRTLSIPPTTTFLKLHFAIQTAFEWSDVHLWQFDILDIPPTGNPCPDRGPPPPTLLRLNAPGIQEYNFGDDIPTPTKKPSETRLCEVLEVPKYKHAYIQYLYDPHGCEWRLSIKLSRRRGAEGASNGAIVCLDGEGGSISEECGGVGGWEEVKHCCKYRKECEEEGEDYECCHGEECDPDADPWNWDKDAINGRLANIDVDMREVEAIRGSMHESDDDSD
jgi:Plasmid pRiA4b ORF-3-like protein